MTSEKTLTGALLIAMPHMQDPRFSGSVIYICGHDPLGAMGLVLNKTLESHSVADLLTQLSLEVDDIHLSKLPVYVGGPIEMGRGFVLHTNDYHREGTLEITPDIFLSATLDVLVSIGEGKGPGQALCALGYAGWMAGQLENELQDNTWLVLTNPDLDLIFQTDPQDKWMKAFEKLGVHPDLLSFDAGHA